MLVNSDQFPMFNRMGKCAIFGFSPFGIPFAPASEAMKKILCVITLTVLFVSAAFGSNSRDAVVLARGKGLLITKADLESYAKRFNRVLTPKVEKKLLKSLLLVKLFALEGRERGVTKDKDDFKAALEYRKWVVKHYKVPEVVIESYYRSHYKLYEADGKLLPLDDKLKKEIADRIKSYAAANILAAERERLMKKYAVELMERSNEGSAAGSN